MNNLVDYFGTSVERLGAFYPTHHLSAVFRNPKGAELSLHKLLSAGFAPSDVIAADGKAVLEFDKEEMDLARFVMQAISRFFATEQVFADHDLEDARKGAGFLAVRCSTDEQKNIAWSLIHACYESWKRRGAEFITEPIPKYGEIRCYIRDPDGYIIEIGQSTDLTYG
jgi:hypothetical protein